MFSRLEKLGVFVGEGQKKEVYQKFLDLADRKKEIYDEDLLHLVEDARAKARTLHYRLDQMHVSSGTGREPRAEVLVYHHATDIAHKEVADGDGPVDAVYKAIDQATGSHHDLISYSIRSVSEGADAMGEVTVLISDGGAYFRGIARSTDVLQASADAYVEALNQLEAFRTEEKSVAFVGNGIMQSFQGGIT